MTRALLLDRLQSYKTLFAEERDFVPRFISLLNNFSRCFTRELVSGHLTGSAWVISPDRQRVIMLHHKKLNRWLQPGGHADGDENLLAVAQKELEEETGLKQYRWLSANIFDLDIHLIPQRAAVPAHFHFDVRFVAEANPSQPIEHNSESNFVEWLTLKEAAEKSNFEPSIERMIAKTHMIR